MRREFINLVSFGIVFANFHKPRLFLNAWLVLSIKVEKFAFYSAVRREVMKNIAMLISELRAANSAKISVLRHLAAAFQTNHKFLSNSDLRHPLRVDKSEFS